jgi:hypothetical protein
VLVAGEGPDEDLVKGGAARPVVAARKGRPRDRRGREWEKVKGGANATGGDALGKSGAYGVFFLKILFLFHFIFKKYDSFFYVSRLL